MIRVVVDRRESRSQVPELLRSYGATVDFRMLDVGDYVVAPECALERKSARDFARSIFSGRVFDQVHRLSRIFRFPVVIVEGDIESAKARIKPSVYWGSLASLALNYGCTTFFTRNEQGTAELIFTLAKKKTFGRSAGPLLVPRRGGRARGLREEQLAILCAIPGIGPKIANQLLKKFGSIRRIVNASEAELATVPKMGKKRANKLVSILQASYTIKQKERQLRLGFEKQ